MSPEQGVKSEDLGLDCGACVAACGVNSPESAAKVEALEGAVDHGFEFASVFHFTALGQAALGFFRAEPRGMAHGLIGPAHLLHFHKKSFDCKFLYATGLPEHALRMNVEVKMAWLNSAGGTSYFYGFRLGCLAVGKVRAGRSLGKSSLVAAVGVYQQELDRSAEPAKADRRHLQGQRFRNPR